MPEQSRQLANKYEDIVNLHGAGILWRLPAHLVEDCCPAQVVDMTLTVLYGMFGFTRANKCEVMM